MLTPLAVGPGLPFPYISGLSLNLGLRVRDPVKGETRFARIKVPPRLPRFLPVDDRAGAARGRHRVCHVERLFPGMEVLDTSRFRVTRDADFSISDESDDLLGAVEAQLRRRRFGHVVRLEVEADAPEGLVEDLMEALEVVEPRHLPHPAAARLHLALDARRPWTARPCATPPWEPRTRSRLRPEEGERTDMFAAIRGGDILVHHPYDDFHTSVERFVEQAVEDPNVLAIKQTVYRTSGDSPIVPALMRAAEQGKQTVCLVEVQARFDEERNIQWARALERAGVHVVYGLSGPEDARQALPGGAPRGRPRAALRPHRHGQLQPLHGPALHRPRHLHLPRGHGRGRRRPLQPPHRLRAPADVPPHAGGARVHLRDGIIREIDRAIDGHSPEPRPRGS